MKRVLSAKLTILSKIILPGLFFFMMGVMTLTMFLGTDRHGRPHPPSSQLIFLGSAVAVTVLFYFTVMSFQKVSVDERFLYVSNFLKEVKIPLSHIADVTEIVWLRGHPVTIHLKTPSAFGRKITFMPKPPGFKFFQPHPIVGELKELAKTGVEAAPGS